MTAQKIAITIDETFLKRVNRLVHEDLFPSRSRAIQEAVREKLERIESNRLARELAKQDPIFEQKLAEGDLGDTLEWPEY